MKLKDKIIFNTIVGTMVAIALGLLVLVAHVPRMLQCNAKAKSFEDHEYGLFSGCMVYHKDRWLPLENIRGFD